MRSRFRSGVCCLRRVRPGNPQDCTSPVMVDDVLTVERPRGVAWSALAGDRRCSARSRGGTRRSHRRRVDQVIGYRVATGRDPLVVLRPDWRQHDDNRRPAEHPDLRPGQDVELIVGPMVWDHRDPLRIMGRKDGKGRSSCARRRPRLRGRRRTDRWRSRFPASTKAS